MGRYIYTLNLAFVLMHVLLPTSISSVHQPSFLQQTHCVTKLQQVVSRALKRSVAPDQLPYPHPMTAEKEAHFLADIRNTKTFFQVDGLRKKPS